MNVYDELRNLKRYLEYRIALKEYNENVAAAKVSFEDFRTNHVEEALRNFDLAEKQKEEDSKWRWSPVYQILRRWPLRNFRAGPWDHTETEWQELCDILLQNTNSEPLSLEYECPHIIRVFLYLVRSLDGSSRPLSHPEKGLHGEYILELAGHMQYSVALMRIAHQLPMTGWSTFPGIHNAAESFDVLFADVAALLGNDLSQQKAVVDKMEVFIGRIAQRAVADMIRMHRGSDLADMWFSVDIPLQRQAKCDQV